MATTPPVTALPRYARGDYPALLKLFNDADKLPATYDAWLERAESTERQSRRPLSMSSGSGFVRSLLRLGAGRGTFSPIKWRA
jgi:hypothetical protein